MAIGLLILLGLTGAQTGAANQEGRLLGAILSGIANSELDRKIPGQCISATLADANSGDLDVIATPSSSKVRSPEQSRFLKEVKKLKPVRMLGKSLGSRERVDALRDAFGAVPADVRSCSSLATISMPVLSHGKAYFVARLFTTCASFSFRGVLDKSKSGWIVDYSEYLNSMSGPPGCGQYGPKHLTAEDDVLMIRGL